MFSLFWRRPPPKNEKRAILCEKGAYCELASSLSPHPLKVGVPTALQDANRAAPVCAYIRPPMSMGGEGLARPKVTRKFVVGLFCGGAFHDVAFTRVGGCNVVRLHDWELRMRKVARSFFPEEGVVRDMDIRAENVGVLMADIGSAVPADDWLHLNAGLPCQDGSKANRRPHPARLREHVVTFWIVVQRCLEKYRKVTWFVENVVCPEFVDTMKMMFPGAEFALVNHSSFSAENRKRAYFASAEFDLTALTSLTGSCTVAEFFDIDQGRGPYLMRSGGLASSRSFEDEQFHRTNQ